MMQTNQIATVPPKGRKMHHSYDESVDEPAKLIAEEAAEVEEEGPAEENEPVEQIDDKDAPDPPVFEQ